jgi:hypothetical protein
MLFLKTENTPIRVEYPIRILAFVKRGFLASGGTSSPGNPAVRGSGGGSAACERHAQRHADPETECDAQRGNDESVRERRRVVASTKDGVEDPADQGHAECGAHCRVELAMPAIIPE